MNSHCSIFGVCLGISEFVGKKPKMNTKYCEFWTLTAEVKPIQNPGTEIEMLQKHPGYLQCKLIHN